MTSPDQPIQPHTSLSPTTSTDVSHTEGSSAATTSSDGTRAIRSFFRTNHFSWKILGGIFATILVVCWVFIIVILIQEEKWQLVLVAWLLLYAAAHFCYWYFKRHHLLSLHSQICGRARVNVGSVRPIEKGPDAPPSYDEILKSEGLPPTYYSVVKETSKNTSKSSPSNKFPIFSLQGLPSVFRRGSSPPSFNSAPSLSQGASTSTANCSSSSPMSKRKGIPSSSSFPSSPPPSISGSIPHRSYSFKSVGRYADPPPYSDSMADVESRIVSPHHSLPPSPRRVAARSVSRQESVVDEALHPIFSPIYNNTNYNSNNSNMNNNSNYNNNNNFNSNNNNSTNETHTRPNTSVSSRDPPVSRSCNVQVEREKNCSTPNV